MESPYWPPRMPEYLIEEKTREKLIPEADYDAYIDAHPALIRRPLQS